MKNKFCRIVTTVALLSIIFFLHVTQQSMAADYVTLNDVSINQSAKFYDRLQRRYFTVNSVTNTSLQPIAGPLRLVVENSSLSVLNAEGLTAQGEPFFTVLDSESALLGPGDTSVDIRIEFQRLRIPLSYTLRAEVALPVATNTAPVANAGVDQTPLVGDVVTLDGSNSTDQDMDALSYSWSVITKPSGSGAVLSDSTAVRPVFTVDLPGAYVVELIVNDGHVDSAPDTVIVDTLNSPPVAHAGSDQTVFVTDLVQLDGSASQDVDHNPLTYYWTLPTVPSGSIAQLDNPNIMAPSFVADLPGTYIGQLIVNDGWVDSVSDSVVISTENSRPVADPGSPQTVYVGDYVQLNGANSSDVDGDALNYRWAIVSSPAGSNAILNGINTSTPSFIPDMPGLYIVQLIVNDGVLDSAPATVDVTALMVVFIDSDNDGLSDAEEADIGTDPNNADTDGDGISDGDEVIHYGTDPLNQDSDGDGISDAAELAGNSDPLDASSTPGGLPPDPAAVAPALDSTIATNLFDSTAFLYSGPNPIQRGVAPETIEAKRVAVLRGAVVDRDGVAISGVKISIKDRPEYGETLTRLDGKFDMAVNGGGYLTIDYVKDGYLPVQRQLHPGWHDWEHAPEVVMIPLDSQVTTIDLGGGAQGAQVARGSPVEDIDGMRQATVLFPEGTTASMVMPDESVIPLSTLNVRATEYTVGPSGPQAMPGELPIASGYTYAVELSVDEAIAAGATSVQFNQPVILYVEDFLDFWAGTVVPVGYYDRQKAAWIPSKDGRVIEIVGVTNGLADVSITGGFPADEYELSMFGITDAERAELARLYEPGQALWRVEVTHFTPYDCNWPYGPISGAEEPKLSESDVFGSKDYEENSSCQEGSIIDCQNQDVGERVSLVGSELELNYRSMRTEGRKAGQIFTVKLIDNQVPENLLGVEWKLSIAGKVYGGVRSTGLEPFTTVEIIWDGKDAYGRDVQATPAVELSVGYRYPMVYFEPSRSETNFEDFSEWFASFGQYSSSDVEYARNTMHFILWQHFDFNNPVKGNFTNVLDGRAWGLGGWSLNNHHIYDPTSQVLHKGNGQVNSSYSVGNAIDSIAGNGESDIGSQDGVLATTTGIGEVWAMDVADDGSIVLATDTSLRLIDPEGVIHKLAGTYEYGVYVGFSGDGGPSVNALVDHPRGVKFASDGSIYFADIYNDRIRRIKDGIITTVAGSGPVEFGYGYEEEIGDGGPATEAKLQTPMAVAFAADGSMYIADSGNYRIRRVGPDGLIETVAGTGYWSDWYDFVSTPDTNASNIDLDFITDIEVAHDGTVYISSYGMIQKITVDGRVKPVAGGGDTWHAGGVSALEARFGYIDEFEVTEDGALYVLHDTYNVSYIGSDGVINIIAGGNFTSGGLGENPAEGDGGLAKSAAFVGRALALNNDGTFLVSDTWYEAIRQVGSIFPGYDSDDLILVSKDGRELYEFSSVGKHLVTRNLDTNEIKYAFNYNANGYLEEITDGDGNITSIERNVNGDPIAFISPEGQQTRFSVDEAGYLTSIANPSNETYEMTYYPGGLLNTFINPNGNSSRMTYDRMGYLVRDENAANGSWDLSRESITNGYVAQMTSALGRQFQYQVEELNNGDKKHTNTEPDGAVIKKLFASDGAFEIENPDRSIYRLKETGDPRFGMQLPVPEEESFTLPSGLSMNATTSRHVTLSDPLDVMSLETVRDEVRVNGRLFVNEYNALTREYTSISPESRVRTTEADAQMRPLKTQVPNLADINYSYDLKGRLVGVVTGSGSEARVFSFQYDTFGNVIESVDPLNRRYGFEYDLAGRVVKEVLPDGRTVNYTYDANGNVTSIQPPGRDAHLFNYTVVDLEGQYSPPETGEGITSVQFAYNLDKELTRLTRLDGQVIDFIYNPGGQLAQMLLPGNQISYGYDALTKQLNSVNTQLGVGLTYTYDGPLLLTEVWSGPVSGEVGRSYDDNLRIIRDSVNGSAIDYGYDLDGLLTQAGEAALTRDAQNGYLNGSVLNNVTTAQNYNVFGELTSLSAQTDMTSLYAVAYQRDLAGRIVEKSETVQGQTHVYQYDYDVSDRLIEVRLDGDTVSSYLYDSNGNRIGGAVQGSTTTAEYDSQDRMTSYNGTIFSYTADGELLTKVQGADETRYEYDVMGNLLKVGLPNGMEIGYVVDGENRRIGRKINGVLASGFLYLDHLNPIAELDGNGNVVSRFVYGSRDFVPDYLIKAGVSYRIVSDHLGSPRLVVNSATGAVVQRIDYDEFGNVVFDSNPGFQPFGFAGGIYDQDTKLTKFGARDYDAEVGRWLAKDPIRFDGGVNLFAYAGNNPVNIIDPTGLRGTPSTNTNNNSGTRSSRNSYSGVRGGVLRNESNSNSYQARREAARKKWEFLNRFQNTPRPQIQLSQSVLAKILRALNDLPDLRLEQDFIDDLYRDEVTWDELMERLDREFEEREFGQCN